MIIRAEASNRSHPSRIRLPTRVVFQEEFEKVLFEMSELQQGPETKDGDGGNHGGEPEERFARPTSDAQACEDVTVGDREVVVVGDSVVGGSFLHNWCCVGLAGVLR